MYPLIIHQGMYIPELAERLEALFGRDFTNEAPTVLANLLNEHQGKDLDELHTVEILLALPSPSQLIYHHPRFPFPTPYNPKERYWCEVEIYQKENQTLVFLSDHDQHDGPSVTNAIQQVMRAVLQIPIPDYSPERLQVLEYSACDGIYSIVDWTIPDWRCLGAGPLGKSRWLALRGDAKPSKAQKPRLA